ncbi:MAG: type II toxin-antitoxin system RelE/ParE family toxin [Caulobacterales bacterium]|nr:type II toxin-antitoxin system RelE/ParE family toxin [Caulobacterales bacterium]
MSRLAVTDLNAVYRYAFEQFGERQADLYFGALQGACQMVARYPGFGRLAEEVSRPVRRLYFRNHIIVYRALSDGVLVLRVLHGSFDVRE